MKTTLEAFRGSTLWRPWACLAAALVLAACPAKSPGSDGGGTGGAAGGGSGGGGGGDLSDAGSGPTRADYYVCVPDPAALNKVTSCLSDDGCPCGSHCSLGRCAASCQTEADCTAGQACDGFGRCVKSAAPVKPSAATAKNSPVTPTALDQSSVGLLTLDSSTVTLDAQHPLGTVSFDVTQAAVDEARFRVTGPIEVQCAEGAAFADECAFTNLAKDTRHVVRVRVNDTSAASANEVAVSTRRQTTAFRVNYVKDATVAPRALEGVYRGWAHPVGFGSMARSTMSGIPAPLAEVSVPVTMTVYAEAAGARVVELSDDFSVLFPEQNTVATLLRASNGDLQLRQGARPFLNGGATDSDVDVAVSMESLAVERGSSGLNFTLRARYAGVLDTANDPYVVWQVPLGWASALPQNATPPTVPAEHAVGDPVTRASVPFVEEAAVEAALGAAFSSASPRTTEHLAQVVVCTPYGAQTATVMSAEIGSTFTGDLGCTALPPATSAQPLDFGLLKERTWQLATTLAHCMTDLRVGAAVASGTMAPGASQGCLDGARALTALKYALDTDRRRALGEQVVPNEVESSLGHRLLQQWLRAHVFVAKQATQVDVLNDVLANESQISRGFKQTEMLDLTGRGFNALLKPRLALPLSRLWPHVVFAPDYRPRVAPGVDVSSAARDEHAVGLPVTLLDSVQQTLGVYGALYERARYVSADRADLENSARLFIRKSFVLAALATALNDSTRANNPSAPSWSAQWTRAQGLYGIGVSGLLRSIDNLKKGENPLGIDDQLDLPLYRVGDQSGSIAKFSAVSDYLLGPAGTSANTAVVPSRVLAAQTALDAARLAWSQNLQQDFVQAQSTSAVSARIEAINRRYGEQIYSLCGDPSMNAATVLATADTINPDSCFVKPSCRPSADERHARLEPGAVASVLCLASSVRERLGAAADPVLLNGFNLADVQPLLSGQVTVKGLRATGPTLAVTMSDGSVVSVSAKLFDRDSAQPPGGVLTPDDLAAMRTRCEALAAATENTRPTDAPTTCAFSGECPGGYFCGALGACQPASDSAKQLACYTGALGELTVAIRSTAKDVDIARSELAELSEAYNVQMRKCAITEKGAQDQIDALKKHNATMLKFAAVKVAADIAADYAAGVGECASAVAEDNKFGAPAAVACGARMTQAVAESVSDGMEFAMGETERAHELAAKQIEANTENQACVQEAEMELVGVKTAVLRIERAAQEVGARLVEMNNKKNDLRALIQEGHEALASETERTVPALSLEFWLDEKVEAYNTAFRAARRAAYLAVLAVEYEYQLSTIERQNVLAATRVADLTGVLERLHNLIATGTVRGRVPSDLHSVVSVRANLLQLADQSNLPPGWHTLTDAQRFQVLLLSPRFAVYDEQGAYAGQQIPFTVAPLASFRLASAGGVPLLSSSDCAERVWSVNAALQGDGLVVGDATRARVTLKKRNRFFSQWCAPAPGGSASAYQVSATRPSRNLFLDPFSDYVPGGPAGSGASTGTVDSANEADAFTAARLQPVLNVAREAFEADQYFNGASRELAGRGLYGDYALFFPAEALARNGSDGLRLEHLNDVLLRFDYVSVAQK